MCLGKLGSFDAFGCSSNYHFTPFNVVFLANQHKLENAATARCNHSPGCCLWPFFHFTRYPKTVSRNRGDRCENAPPRSPFCGMKPWDVANLSKPVSGRRAPIMALLWQSLLFSSAWSITQQRRGCRRPRRGGPESPTAFRGWMTDARKFPSINTGGTIGFIGGRKRASESLLQTVFQ